jgi:alpha-1,2-mannosyltransferase
MSKQRHLAIATFICGGFGLTSWLFYGLVFAGKTSTDFMVFYAAVRAYFENDLGVLADGVRFTAVINEIFADWLASPIELHPWVNPPSFLLILLPFGVMPFAEASVVFMGVTFAGLFAALRLHASSEREMWIYACALVLCPATAYTAFVGQNTFLTAALLIAGFALASRKPILAGILLGILSYKPQFCMMVPIALIAARQWRVLANAAAAAIAIAAASGLVFGVALWQVWFDFLTGASPLFHSWATEGLMKGQSVYTCAILLGADKTFAFVVQVMAALIAAASVYWCFSNPMRPELQLAVLLAATILAAPDVSTSDSLLLGIAATSLFIYSLGAKIHLGDTVFALCIWASPLMSPPSVFPAGLMTPLLVLLFIGWAMYRGHRDPRPLQPAGRFSAV